MASACLRTSRLRQIYNALALHSQPLRPSNFHSPPLCPRDSFYPDYRLLPFISRGHPRLLSTSAVNQSVQNAAPSTQGTSSDGGQVAGGSQGKPIGGGSSSPVENAAPSSGSGEGTSSGGGQDAGGSQDTSQKGKPIRGGPISWMSLFLLLCTGAGLVYYYDWKKKQRIEAITTASSVVKEGASVGKAAIGGPFDLIDHNGKPISDKDFIGKWTIIYFGFTHCPDICPDELQKLASAIDLIKIHSGLEVVPVFISVDPERDTVEHVREYVKEFHPMLIGLTGSPEQVKKAARAYRVYYMKTQEEDSDYLVDHSIAMYLMDPNMEFVKFFGKNLGDKELAEGVIKEMKQHKIVKV